MQWHVYQIELTPLSPIHIGDGSVVEGYEHCLRDRTYYKIELSRLINRLPAHQRENLIAAMQSNLTAFRTLVAEYFEESDKEYACRASSAFEDTVTAKLADPRNQLMVSPFIRQDGCPYIPGSSIKGAIRTALLANLLGGKKINTQDYGGCSDILEASLLGYLRNGDRPKADIPGDPLKGLRVTDVSLRQSDIYVDKVETWRLGPRGRERLSLQTLCELTEAILTGTAPVARGELRLYEGFLNTGPVSELREQGAEYIKKACNSFYLSLLKNESSHLGRLAESVRAAGGFVLRLGWGSGLDSVSLNTYLERPRKVKTFKLTSEGYPLGWLAVRVCSMTSH